MPLWGQFLDRRGELRESMAESFLNTLAQTSNLSDIGKWFPFQALTVTAPARQFYEFYRV
jgi:hypothetical protein